MQNQIQDPFGVLVVDKPLGMTSHDIVAKVRKKFGIKKVGHAGTLDPAATGVLVLLLGKATKLSDKFINQDKEYTAVLKLGERTDSADAEGEIIETRDVNVSDKMITRVVSEFLGEIDQVPPMFSAKKRNGKKLYQLARKGVVVEREPKKVTINEIEVEKIELPLVSMRVLCGKGTYIRQLADDIGERLGCGAHLSALRRTASGDFNLGKAIGLDDLMTLDRDKLDILVKSWAWER